MSKDICLGCGVKIQTTSPNKLGFLPKAALLNIEKNGRQTLCQRCFKIKNYNNFTKTNITSSEVVDILDKLKEKRGLAVMVVDVFAFSSTLIKDINSHLHNKDLIVVANKFDLIPKSVKPEKIIRYIAEKLKINKINPLAITLVSAKKRHGIAETKELIDKYRQGKDVYILGVTNVGKSTFINALLNEFTGDNKDVVTTSYFPNTTLNIVKIPIDKNSFLIDTPGIINEYQYIHYFDENTLKIATPKKELKPKIYQLNSGQTVFIGGLVRFDFLEGNKHSFVFYTSNELLLHRTKLEQADNLFEKHRGTLLSPPNVENIDKIGSMKRNHFAIKKQKVDIVIAGLGWVSVDADDIEVDVYVSKKVSVHVRKSII